MMCKYHKCAVDFIGHKDKIYCSKNCAVKDRVLRIRRLYKIRAVQLFGGKCSVCGYNRCIRALQFHHVDRAQKKFALSSNGFTRSWKNWESELVKCVLLCANCHAEEEDRIYNET